MHLKRLAYTNAGNYTYLADEPWTVRPKIPLTRTVVSAAAGRQGKGAGGRGWGRPAAGVLLLDQVSAGRAGRKGERWPPSSSIRSSVLLTAITPSAQKSHRCHQCYKT